MTRFDIVEHDNNVMAITEVHVVSGQINLTPGTTVNIGSGTVQTSVSGNVVNVSGQHVNVDNFPATNISGQSVNVGNFPNNSISGQTVLVADGGLVAQLSGISVQMIAPPQIPTQVVTPMVPISGELVNVFPSQALISGFSITSITWLTVPSGDTAEYIIGPSASGQQPFMHLSGGNGFTTYGNGWFDAPLTPYVYQVTDMNQLAITTFSGANGFLQLWAVIASGAGL